MNADLKKSLHGKVDLIRVKDARKAFRRRYASRINAEKIFNQFDKDGKGHVDAFDIQEQAKTINVTISLDEAQVILQSAQGQNQGKLDINEFRDLMFSKDDTLNVDLTKLHPLQPKVYEKKPDTSIKYEKFVQDEKTRNNWKYFLQKSLMTVANDLLQGD